MTENIQPFKKVIALVDRWICYIVYNNGSMLSVSFPLFIFKKNKCLKRGSNACRPIINLILIKCHHRAMNTRSLGLK